MAEHSNGSLAKHLGETRKANDIPRAGEPVLYDGPLGETWRWSTPRDVRQVQAALLQRAGEVCQNNHGLRQTHAERASLNMKPW